MAHIAEVIKFEGDTNSLIWKHPCEDFNTKSQLIVDESQEAILFMEGQALDAFGPGRYTLDTKNIPLLGRFVKFVMGGETPFHCKVYFINKTVVQTAIRWGTSDKIRIREPEYNCFLDIGANGELSLEVADSRRLLLKLVGTKSGIAWNEGGTGFTKSLQETFRLPIVTAVRDCFISEISRRQIGILQLEGELTSIAETIRISLLPKFEEYGLTIPHFQIKSILYPENDPNYRKIMEMSQEGVESAAIDYQGRMTTKKVTTEGEVEKTKQNVVADVERNALDNQAELEQHRRAAQIEKERTDIELTKLQMEKERILRTNDAELKYMEGQVDAQIKQMSGMADAEIMRAKGYTHKDEIDAEIKKAYAEGIGNMSFNGTGGGIAGDMLNIGLGMAVAGAVAPQMGTMLNGMSSTFAQTPAPAAAPATVACPICGNSLSANAKFCPACGSSAPTSAASNTIVCPHCHSTVSKGKFCPECGKALIVACPGCGKIANPGEKFCSECGVPLK